MSVECFLIAPSDHANLYLRRYVSSSECPNNQTRDGGLWIHEARTELISQVPMTIAEDHTYDIELPEIPDEDSRWPTHCAHGCGYVFTDEDEHQRFTEAIYVGPGGAEWEIQHLPPGAIFDAVWMGDWGRVNGSGPCWSIVLPNGRMWHPGMEATNCTRKGEDHDCWCVHGEAPVLTVDKQPEPGRSTCQAGAGSILSEDWHGFLRDGWLVVA